MSRPCGRVETLKWKSEALAENALGDPSERELPVYLPPGYDEGGPYPVVYVLTGFTGRGRMLLNDEPWEETIAERMDRLIAQKKASPLILALPDCFTRLGGSQYLNSTATGRYQDYLVNEVVARVDESFRTLADRGARGVMGKSSGGYGALVMGFHHPGVFGAVACHSGDMYFDYCYRGDIPPTLDAVSKAGGLDAFLEEFLRKPRRETKDILAMNVVAMAACYSPNPDSKHGFDLPVDLETGELVAEVWERWLEHDPVRLLDRHADALRGLKLLFVDCGTTDEFHLHHGARIFTRKLRELGIEHHYEEFDDGHMKISYRYDRSLEMLSRALGTNRAA
jgi:enterochelin esterase-like enzyme